MKSKIIPPNAIEYTPHGTGLKAMLASSNPTDPSSRKPLLWLVRRASETEDEVSDLFLINLSDEVLRRVISYTGRSTSFDGGALAMNDKDAYDYTDVQPGYGVKVDEFVERYDCDYLIHTSISVESDRLGRLEIASPMEKGGVRHCVLIWDDMQPGRHVGVRRSTE